MSTLSTTSAVFNEVSGPHEGPGSYLPLWAPQAGLGQAETNYQAETNFMGPNTVLTRGPVVIHIGQSVPMTVFLNNGVRLTANTVADAEALRGRLEARAERNGLATRTLWMHQSGQHVIWTVTPQVAPVTEDQAKKVLRDAVLEELPASAAVGNTVIAFLSTLPVGRQTSWMQTPSIPWTNAMEGLGAIERFGLMTRVKFWVQRLMGVGGAISPTDGLGDIFSDIARGATTVSADLVCSPAFQAVAAQDIARRHGEEHARTFREAFRQATAFCSPGAQARAAARQAEAEKRNAMLVGLGVVGVAVALLGVWHFTKKRANGRRRSRRRNPYYAIQAHHAYDLNLTAKQRRLGYQNMTETGDGSPTFYLWAQDGDHAESLGRRVLGEWPSKDRFKKVAARRTYVYPAEVGDYVKNRGRRSRRRNRRAR